MCVRFVSNLVLLNFSLTNIGRMNEGLQMLNVVRTLRKKYVVNIYKYIEFLYLLLFPIHMSSNSSNS